MNNSTEKKLEENKARISEIFAEIKAKESEVGEILSRFEVKLEWLKKVIIK